MPSQENILATFCRADASTLVALLVNDDEAGVTAFLDWKGVLNDQRLAVEALLFTGRLIEEMMSVWLEAALSGVPGRPPSEGEVRGLVKECLDFLSMPLAVE